MKTIQTSFSSNNKRNRFWFQTEVYFSVDVSYLRFSVTMLPDVNGIGDVGTESDCDLGFAKDKMEDKDPVGESGVLDKENPKEPIDFDEFSEFKGENSVLLLYFLY
jgi:hypothetical protein